MIGVDSDRHDRDELRLRTRTIAIMSRGSMRGSDDLA